jgi:nitrate/nitrite transporter NarK
MLECRTVMAIGAGLMIVGAWTRSLAMLDNNYWWVVIGQLIIACAGPTISSPISIIANNWFGDHERAKATSLMSLSNPLGSLVSFIIQAVYIAITEEKTKNLTTAEAQQIVRQETLAMLNVESAMITFVVLFFFLAFRQDKPPSPPSAAALVKREDITKGMWNDTKTLASNFNFMLVLAIFAMVYTVYAALGFVIDPLLVPFNY